MEWKYSKDVVSYPSALEFMEARVGDIRDDQADECVWLLEHPSLYTAGTSANAQDLLNPQFPVFDTGRGGQYTYHGPGQRVGYIMLDLKKRYESPDIKHFIYTLEQWIIDALATFDVKGERREGRVGIWVVQDNGMEEKIAAIGVRIRRWVSFHGISINVTPDLSHFSGIVPCGIAEHGVTSLKALGKAVTMAQLDDALKETCPF